MDVLHGYDGVVIFDQDCALCSFWVRFLLKHDRRKRFRFSGQYSEWYAGVSDQLSGSGMLASQGVVLVETSGEISTGIQAVTGILKILGGWWRILLAYRIFPQKIQNWLYGVIAANRYKWFGRQRVSCQVLLPEFSDRFLQ